MKHPSVSIWCCLIKYYRNCVLLIHPVLLLWLCRYLMNVWKREYKAVLLLLHQSSLSKLPPLGIFHFLLWLLALLNVNIITGELWAVLSEHDQGIYLYTAPAPSHVVNDIDKMLPALTKCLYSILAIENTAQWSSQCYVCGRYEKTHINGYYQKYISLKDPLSCNQSFQFPCWIEVGCKWDLCGVSLEKFY